MLVAIIQCRVQSTRLPKKALKQLGDQRLIDHVVERAKTIRGVDRVVLNVPYDNIQLFDVACDVYPIQGQEEDVLKSYLTVAEHEGAEAIMRLTGDCPLLAPDVCERAVRMFECGDMDYVATVGTVAGEGFYTTWADGWDCEIFTRRLLQKAAVQATEPYDRQHVTTWMRKAVGWRCGYAPAPEDYSALKCSVDTLEDFQRVEQILAHVKPDDFSYLGTWDAWQRAGRP